MHLVTAILETLPEPGRLALMGFLLISAAILIRRLLAPSHAPLSTSAKADLQAK